MASVAVADEAEASALAIAAQAMPRTPLYHQRVAHLEAQESAAMLKRFNELGSRIAGRIADLAGAPLAILLVALFCAAWFLEVGQAGENLLSLILSVASIALTQMVLNGQRRSEQALHLKMDELVYAMRGARDEVAGIEAKTIDELEALRRSGDAAEDELQERGIDD